MDVEQVKALISDLRAIDECEAGHGQCEGCAYVTSSAADFMEEVVGLMETTGASNLKAYWEGLSPEERKELRRKAGLATWKKNDREAMREAQRLGHARESVEARRARSRKGARAMHAKYDPEVKREWARRGGQARAARRKTDAEQD